LHERRDVGDHVRRDDRPRRRPLERRARDLVGEALDEPVVDLLGRHQAMRSGARDVPARLPSVSPFLRNTRSSWIFSCSFITPYSSASGRGGQPGTYTSTGITSSTPFST